MSKPGDLLTLLVVFGSMSLFAIGGAAAAIPEFHRIAVEQYHWMTDAQFADIYAISQLSPGPNVLIVTLIGYQVAGLLGGIVATAAMCGPTAVLSYVVSRVLHRASDAKWPALVQAALVPLSIGLMSASALVLALAADRNAIAVALTGISAALIWRTRINPLWLLLAGGCLGFAGVT
jgi:chromate transporter